MYIYIIYIYIYIYIYIPEADKHQCDLQIASVAHTHKSMYRTRFYFKYNMHIADIEPRTVECQADALSTKLVIFVPTIGLNESYLSGLSSTDTLF